MILDGNSMAGEGKVYSSAREMKLERENTKLQAKLDLAIEALGFYANEKSWRDIASKYEVVLACGINNGTFDCIIYEDCEKCYEDLPMALDTDHGTVAIDSDGDAISIGGKFARVALAKIKEIGK